VLTLLSALLLALAGGGGSGGGPSTPGPSPSSSASQAWLSTSGNRILGADGSRWMGRGVNIHDTRSCNACTFAPPDVSEVKCRIEEAVDRWGASFLRLDLESYASAEGRVHFQGVLRDPAYLAHVREIVSYVATKRGVYVLVSLWQEPTVDDLGLPTAATIEVWRRLAQAFRDDAHVMFGVVNEPEFNFDGTAYERAWQAMNATVAPIRAVEDSGGGRHHLVAVQGTRAFARALDYYVAKPIAAGGGQNVVYETHVYDPASTFQSRFVGPSATLPVIIGEFGPAVEAGMTIDDCRQLMTLADSLSVPYLAWTFHPRCSPNLLQDLTGGACGVGMPLAPTNWGTVVREHLLSTRTTS
jgi:endoglucanase